MGGLINMIFGGGGNSAVSGASDAANKMANNAQKVNQELMNLISQLGGQFQSGFAPLMSPELQGFQQLLQQIPGLQEQLMGPTALQGVSPALSGFFSGEMKQGLDPSVIEGAHSALQQQFGQSMSDILAHAGPGQNPAALMRAGQNQLLSSDVNLGTQLAGESQGVKERGAQGLASTAGALDEQQLQRLLESVQLPQGILQSVMQYLGLGTGLETAGLGPLGGLGSQYANAASQDAALASQAAQQQQQQQSGLFNSLVGLAANYFLPGVGGALSAFNTGAANAGADFFANFTNPFAGASFSTLPVNLGGGV